MEVGPLLSSLSPSSSSRLSVDVPTRIHVVLLVAGDLPRHVLPAALVSRDVLTISILVFPSLLP